MSIREALIQRAIVSTEAACGRAGRMPVVALMDRFSISHVGEFNSRTLDAVVSYIEEVEALPAAPPKVPVKFLIGDEVAFNYPHGSGRPTGVVVGYEVRYLVAMPGRMSAPTFGHRADKLKLRFNTIEPVESVEPRYFEFEGTRYAKY